MAGRCGGVGGVNWLLGPVGALYGEPGQPPRQNGQERTWLGSADAQSRPAPYIALRRYDTLGRSEPDTLAH